MWGSAFGTRPNYVHRGPSDRAFGPLDAIVNGHTGRGAGFATSATPVPGIPLRGATAKLPLQSGSASMNYPRHVVTLIAVVCASALGAQVVTIEAGQHVVWRDSLPAFDTLLVRGELVVAPTDSLLRPELCGIVVVRPGAALELRFVTLPSLLEPGTPALIAGAGSRVAVTGIFGARAALSGDSCAVPAPLLDLRCDSAVVERSRFWGIGPLVAVRGRGGVIEECGFTVGLGNALEFGPTAPGGDLEVRGCDFAVEPGPGEEATGCRLFAPYARVIDCDFFVLDHGTGLSMRPRAGTPHSTPNFEPAPGAAYALEAVRMTHEGRPGGLGLEIVGFDSIGGLAIRDPVVEGFAEGAHLVGAGVVLEGGRFVGNDVGLRLAGASVHRSTIEGPGGVGIRVEAHRTLDGDTATIKNLQLANLRTGLEVAGGSDPMAVLDSIRFRGVGARLRFSGESEKALLYSAERLVLDDDDDRGARGKPHDAVRVGPSATAHVYVHRTSGLITEACARGPELEACVECPRSSFGTLHVATGRGAELPVHEHEDALGSVVLAKADSGWVDLPARGAQRTAGHVAAEEWYALDASNVAALVDVHLDWRADRPLRLSLGYPHAQPVALQACGRLLPRVDSLAGLADATTSSYYVDPDAGRVELLLVPSGGRAQVIVYRREVELPLRGNRGAITLRQLKGTHPGQYAVAVGNALAKVTLTDLDGEPIARSAQAGPGGTPFGLTHYTGRGGWVVVEFGRERFRVPLLLPGSSEAQSAAAGP